MRRYTVASLREPGPILHPFNTYTIWDLQLGAPLNPHNDNEIPILPSRAKFFT